jgi:hypothetical protein
MEDEYADAKIEEGEATPTESGNEIGRITGATADIIVRVTDFKGNKYIDIRKFLHGERYQGWSRKGISLKIEYLDDLITFLNKIRERNGQKKTEEGKDT